MFLVLFGVNTLMCLDQTKAMELEKDKEMEKKNIDDPLDATKELMQFPKDIMESSYYKELISSIGEHHIALISNGSIYKRYNFKWINLQTL